MSITKLGNTVKKGVRKLKTPQMSAARLMEKKNPKNQRTKYIALPDVVIKAFSTLCRYI